MKSSGNLSEILKNEVENLWIEAASKEFLVSMARGTLDMEKFKNYMIQDYLYLKDYIEILKMIREMSEDDALNSALDKIITDTEYETYKVHVPNLKNMGISEDKIEHARKGQIIVDYIGYMQKMLKEQGVIAGLTALLQCSWNYAYIAELVSEKYADELSESKYRNWFEAYTADEYIWSNQLWIDLLDERTKVISQEETSRLCGIFHTCAEYENKLWDFLSEA